MNKAGIIFTVVSALIYGFTPVLCSFTYAYGNTGMTLTFFRSFFVIPVLFFIMKNQHISLKLTKDEAFSILLVGLIGSVGATSLLYSSYRYVGVGTATTLHFLYPLFVMLIAKFFYKDAVSKRQLLALMIAGIGISFFIDFKDLVNLKGVFMAASSGLCFAIYLIIIEKRKLTYMNGYKLSFYLACVVASTLFITNLFFHYLVFQQPLISYGLMFMVAILASFIAIICLKEGVKRLGSAYASVFSLLEPISSVFFGFLFLKEAITLNKIVGCIIIINAIMILANISLKDIFKRT